MKSLFSFILLFFFSVSMLSGFSQFPCITFDNNVNLGRIHIDSNTTGNVWEIGFPHKTWFHRSHSMPNSIVTGLLYPYPVNNTSVFYLVTPDIYGYRSHNTYLEFVYKMDCDTLLDAGRLDYSLDNGATYRNVFSEGNYYWVMSSDGSFFQSTYTSDDTVLFTGWSKGWYDFFLDIYLDEIHYDSIIYRFSFHSDSLFENRDGWMIDDICYWTWWEGISTEHETISVFPNPVTNLFKVNSKILISDVRVLNIFGETVYQDQKSDYNFVIDLDYLPSGSYFLRVSYNDGRKLFRKVIKIP